MVLPRLHQVTGQIATFSWRFNRTAVIVHGAIGIVFRLHHEITRSVIGLQLPGWYDLPIPGKGTKTMVLYFTATGNSLSVAKRIGERHGLHFSYINGMLMVDNYLPMFDMNKELTARDVKLSGVAPRRLQRLRAPNWRGDTPY